MVAPLATMHVAMVIVVARGLKTKLRPRVVHSRLSFDSLDRCLTMVLTLAIFIYVYFFFLFFSFVLTTITVTLLFLCYTRFFYLPLSLIYPSFFPRSLERVSHSFHLLLSYRSHRSFRPLD